MLVLVASCAATNGTPVAMPSAAPTATAEPASRPKVTVVPRPTEIPAPASTSVAAGALNVVLQRSGGLAGHTETFVLRPDGTVSMTYGNMHVPGGSSAALQLARNVAATNILSVPPGDYSPSNACCDRYVFELTIVLDGKSYHYVTMEGADSTPAALRETIDLIQAYIISAQ